jgi:hypothetical protein
MSPRTIHRLAILATALIVVACWIPDRWLHESRVQPTGNTDKLIHGSMFALFGALWTLGDPSSRRRARIIAGGLLLAVVTEVGQGHPWVHRDPDVLDGVADVVGMALGIAAGRSLAPRLVRDPAMAEAVTSSGSPAP